MARREHGANFVRRFACMPAVVWWLPLAGCTGMLGLDHNAHVEGANAECPEGDCASCSTNDDCMPNASCISGVCTTTTSDGGTVASSCAELSCGAHSECVVTGSEATCQCSKGYEPRDGACADVDECALPERGGCSINAYCTNVEGTRACTCKEGFKDTRGDGTECVGECTLAECHAEATCAVVDATPVCTCPPTHVGDGVNNCEFDAECALLSCDENATCEVEGGERACVCKAGYQKDGGGRCVNVDECANPHHCGKAARCVDSVGSWECVPCGAGYEASSDGRSCTDADECVNGNHACGDHGECMNSAGGYACKCDEGYSANLNAQGQPTCTLTGYCEAGLDNCVDPVNHGTCESTGGMGFKCGCMSGYAGNGVLTSSGGTGCTRIPRCSTDNNCAARQTCKDTATGITCECQPGPASCPNGQAGKYCANATTVGTCTADANGCIYIDTTQSQTCDATQRLTCSSGACVCKENDKLCDDDKSPLSCVSGRWIEFPACTSTQICRDKKGCVTNEPYEVGNYDNAGWVAYDIPNNFFYCFDFRLAHRATIEYFRFRGSGTGGRCDLGVYDDAGGKPGAFRTSNFDIMLATNGVAYSQPSATVTLNADTTYWLCGACFRNGGKVPLYVRAGRSIYFETTDYQFVTPASVIADNEYTYPFYMQVRDVP